MTPGNPVQAGLGNRLERGHYSAHHSPYRVTWGSRTQKLTQVSVFIDGAHLYHVAHLLGIEIDHAKLLPALLRGAQLHGAYFYTNPYPENSTPENRANKHTPQAAFLQQIESYGYRVVTSTHAERPLSAGQSQIAPSQQQLPHSTDFSEGIIAEMITQAAFSDRLVVVSANERLAEARKYVALQGTSTVLVTLPSMASDRLRASADRYTDITDLKPYIQRLVSA